MASSFLSCPVVSSSLISTTKFPLLSSGSICNGVGKKKGCLKFKTLAKFDKFQGEEVEKDFGASSAAGVIEQLVDENGTEYEEMVEDDSCLPSDLEGAVRQSGIASATFVSSGGMRAMVELLVPQLQFLDEEGAQAELWELSRVFLDTLIEETGCQRVRAVFPDAGAAALLQYRWAVLLLGFQPRPLIMWNPRLVSEDVGVGFNVRKLRRNFLSKFTAVYYMRPLPSGAVFRCYPGYVLELQIVESIYDDKERRGRYLLAKELLSRPDAEELQIIYGM
ncbi:unnamed protein product [Rhodiola kirilowii]